MRVKKVATYRSGVLVEWCDGSALFIKFADMKRAVAAPGTGTRVRVAC